VNDKAEKKNGKAEEDSSYHHRAQIAQEQE
jgi:hypothetical protein